VPKWSFADPLDFVLLDGPHAYPFPDLEYYYIYPHIRKGGVLVVDDIHIPSIHRMYEFLRDDEMWEHCSDVRTTSFFRRTDKPIFDPLEGNWPNQRYNRRRFASPEALESTFGPGWYQSEFGIPGPTVAVATLDGKDLNRTVFLITDCPPIRFPAAWASRKSSCDGARQAMANGGD
jgi:hypothetical protein